MLMFAPYSDDQSHHDRLLNFSLLVEAKINWLTGFAWPFNSAFWYSNQFFKSRSFLNFKGTLIPEECSFANILKVFLFFTNLSTGPISPSWSWSIFQSSFEILVSLTWTCPDYTKSPALQPSGIAQQFCSPLGMACTNPRIHGGEISLSVPGYPGQCFCICLFSTSVIKLEIIISQVYDPPLPSGIPT